MAKYTPGEWHVKPATGFEPTRVYGANRYLVCEVSDLAGQPAEANAHLIAESPELLEVLSQVLAALRARWHPESDVGPLDLLYDLEPRIASAIARAKGEGRDG